MRFDVLHNFISPVTGRVLCDHNYILVGNANGIAIPTISIPAGNLPNLSFTKFWVGNATNRPVECIVDLPVCYATSTSNIIAIYDNGNNGVGATLTLSTGGIFSIDGVFPPIGSFVLIKDQILNYQNGVYVYTANLPLIILTRADFYDESQEIRQGDVINVQFGNTHELSTWVQTQIVNTIGTSSIDYIGPIGPPGPQGPQGAEGPRGPRGPSGGGGGGDSIFGRIAGGIANGIANAIVNRLTDTALGGLALAVSTAGLVVSAVALSNSLNKPRGAQYTSVIPTLDLVANLNLHNARIENIAQSPGGDFDAVSARWVWDLLNDNVEIKWE